MSTALKPKILIFLSSVRPNRMGDRVGKLVRITVEAHGMEPIMFDPAEMPFELLKTPLHFMSDPETMAPAWMKEANDTIVKADGFIIVSSEYNCGIPPALSNMICHFSPTSYRHRPCGLVTYSLGSFGGVRAWTFLQPFCSELGMVTVPCTVPIPSVKDSIDENGNCKVDRIETNMVKLVKEVRWYANAIKSYKIVEPTPPHKSYAVKDDGSVILV